MSLLYKSLWAVTLVSLPFIIGGWLYVPGLAVFSIGSWRVASTVMLHLHFRHERDIRLDEKQHREERIAYQKQRSANRLAVMENTKSKWQLPSSNPNRLYLKRITKFRWKINYLSVVPLTAGTVVLLLGLLSKHPTKVLLAGLFIGGFVLVLVGVFYWVKQGYFFQNKYHHFERTVQVSNNDFINLKTTNLFSSLKGVECFLYDIMKACEYEDIPFRGEICIEKVGTFSNIKEAIQAIRSTRVTLNDYTVILKLDFVNFVCSEQFLNEWIDRNKYRNYIQ